MPAFINPEEIVSDTLLTARIDLKNDRMRFEAVLRDNAPVITDYIPPLGDGQGYTPLELFLISLLTCSGGTIVSLLRKKRKTVVSYSMSAEGYRREEHPTSFSKIVLHCELVSPDATDEDMRRCIELSEEKYCPVWAMIKGNVEVVCDFKIHLE
jgi:putative redox protein